MNTFEKSWREIHRKILNAGSLPFTARDYRGWDRKGSKNGKRYDFRRFSGCCNNVIFRSLSNSAARRHLRTFSHFKGWVLEDLERAVQTYEELRPIVSALRLEGYGNGLRPLLMIEKGGVYLVSGKIVLRQPPRSGGGVL